MIFYMTEIRELLDFVVNVLHRRCGMFRSVFFYQQRNSRTLKKGILLLETCFKIRLYCGCLLKVDSGPLNSFHYLKHV